MYLWVKSDGIVLNSLRGDEKRFNSVSKLKIYVWIYVYPPRQEDCLIRSVLEPYWSRLGSCWVVLFYNVFQSMSYLYTSVSVSKVNSRDGRERIVSVLIMKCHDYYRRTVSRRLFSRLLTICRQRLPVRLLKNVVRDQNTCPQSTFLQSISFTPFVNQVIQFVPRNDVMKL